MNKRLLTRFAVIAVVAILGYFQKDKIGGSTDPSPQVSKPVATQQAEAKTPALKADLNFDSPKLVMKNMQIRDVDGSIAYRGDVDLEPTLDRIRAGKRDSHSNDGSVFGNRERLLPQKERGYYREYVVRTPGIRHAGPQRIIMGKNGEVYYTHDHYQSFTQVKP
ncbi:MAG: ribonuclease domain-containing protein [Verrucomicrobiales bacterium]|nr:ribonuclease domain-containing protein [Verrucomicrobiales bacterium]